MLPETDDDAVRILTIHGAKGLEFPITIVSGMTTRAQSRTAGVQLRFPHDRDTYALRVSARVTTEEFERYAPIDEQMDFHEKLRLLYVAMTRARDHLVVSVHRPAKEPGADRTTWTHAQLLWHAAADAAGWAASTASSADDAVRRVATGRPGTRQPTAVAGVARRPRRRPRAWRAADASAPPPRWRGRRPTPPTRPATPAWPRVPRDLELPPWNKGRYGTALGRAGARGAADRRPRDRRRHRRHRRRPGRGRRDHRARGAVAARARVALATDTVREAVRHGFHREMYVATPVGGTTLEGYVDLVYRRPDGLVVVDYKTDAWRDDADLDAKVARYRLQGASYAVALERATGSPVAECVFLFLGEHDARASCRQRSAGGDA